MKCFLCFILLASTFQSFSTHLDNVLGIKTQWESSDDIVSASLKTQIETIAKNGKYIYDPNCLWRKLENDICHNPFPEKSADLIAKAKLFHKETLGFFNAWKSLKKKWDFGGIWQGHALDQLIHNVPGNWIVDFSGDVFVTDASEFDSTFEISDYIVDIFPYADVKIINGFMIASTSARIGGSIYYQNKKTQSSTDNPNEVLKIVLFADKNFSGTRLDAWATGVIAGGKKILAHLWELKEFKNQWAYFYFDLEGNAHCSTNIKCQLTENPKTITVPQLLTLKQ